MPEILRVGGFRFFFFSREGHEPRHIHVEQAERYAKCWLEAIELAEARGFRGSELRKLHSIIEEHRDKFIVTWDEHFGQYTGRRRCRCEMHRRRVDRHSGGPSPRLRATCIVPT